MILTARRLRARILPFAKQSIISDFRPCLRPAHPALLCPAARRIRSQRRGGAVPAPYL